MSQFPTITAGQEITASLLTSMLPIYVVKQANTDRVNNTFAADPELTVNVPANVTFLVEFFLMMGGGTTGDVRTRWAVPSGASGLRSVTGPGSTAADGNADNITCRMGVHQFGTAVNYSGVRNAPGNLFRVYEYAMVSTGVGGTLAVEWAQVTTDATTAARMSSGSFIKLSQTA